MRSVFSLYEIRIVHRYWAILIIPFALFIVITSCQKETTETSPSFNGWVLTPISEATLSAYQHDIPVMNMRQAVIAARAGLLTSSIRPIGNPRVISAEFIRYADAIIQMQAKAHSDSALHRTLDVQYPCAVFSLAQLCRMRRFHYAISAEFTAKGRPSLNKRRNATR